MSGTAAGGPGWTFLIDDYVEFLLENHSANKRKPVAAALCAAEKLKIASFFLYFLLPFNDDNVQVWSFWFESITTFKQKDKGSPTQTTSVPRTLPKTLTSQPLSCSIVFVLIDSDFRHESNQATRQISANTKVQPIHIRAPYALRLLQWGQITLLLPRLQSHYCI